jgi:cytochrome P450
LLVAAHDTTSTTLLWGIKYLTKHQGIQSKLRSTLRSTFTNARSEKRVPSAHEIATAQSHYLDAFIEELNRHSTTGMPSRNTTKDAVVLGHVIPKGTRVFFLTPGGGIIHPAYDIPDHLRSEQYLKAGGGKTGTWDPNGIELFNPDRWLVYDKEMDSVVYDAMAGPHIAFGGGLRGCFGKKMAYLEMRLAIVLMVWTFKFLEVPEKYGGWEAQDGLTHVTVQCYVKLAKA